MRRVSLVVLVGFIGTAGGCEDDERGVLDSGSGDGGGVITLDGGMDGSLSTPDAAQPGTDSGAPDGGKLSGAALIKRGQYLVENVGACGDCHTPRNPDGSPDLTRVLAGVDCLADAVPDDPALGCIRSRNLTNHETGLKNRSDQEIKDMFLKGVRPDGKALLPIMPYYVLGNMSDQDADAIVAFLRTVPGVDHMVGPNQAPIESPPQAAPRWPKELIPHPQPSYPDQAAALRGRYLAGEFGVCMECHTPRDEMDAPIISKAFQGANEFQSALLGLPPVFPAVIYSANITPHQNGIAGWTVDDIVRAIKEGQDKDQNNSPLCPPMPAGPMGAFAGITDEDARDMAHYLLSIAPGDNMVPQDCQLPAPPPDGGAGGTPDAGVSDAGASADAAAP